MLRRQGRGRDAAGSYALRPGHEETMLFSSRPELFDRARRHRTGVPHGAPARDRARARDDPAVPVRALLARSPAERRDRRLIASVVIEEMAALGARLQHPQRDRRATRRSTTPQFIPSYPGPLPGGVESQLVVPLERFSRELVQDVFMEIEEPEDPLRFQAADGAPQRTIGMFYDRSTVRSRPPEDSMFTGAPGAPGDRRLLRPRPDVVHDAATASVARSTRSSSRARARPSRRWTPSTTLPTTTASARSSTASG